MRSGLCLLVLLASLAAPEASMIYGDLWKTSGLTRDCDLNFRPLSTPFWIGTNYITSGEVNTRSTNGIFQVTLVAGFYHFTIGGRSADSQVLNVPNDTNTYNFVELLTSANAWQYASLAGYVKVSDNDTSLARLADKLQAGDSITITRLHPGAAEALRIDVAGITTVITNVVPGVITNRLSYVAGVLRTNDVIAW